MDKLFAELNQIKTEITQLITIPKAPQLQDFVNVLDHDEETDGFNLCNISRLTRL